MTSWEWGGLVSAKCRVCGKDIHVSIMERRVCYSDVRREVRMADPICQPCWIREKRRQHAEMRRRETS